MREKISKKEMELINLVTEGGKGNKQTKHLTTDE